MSPWKHSDQVHKEHLVALATALTALLVSGAACVAWAQDAVFPKIETSFNVAGLSTNPVVLFDYTQSDIEVAIFQPDSSLRSDQVCRIRKLGLFRVYSRLFAVEPHRHSLRRHLTSVYGFINRIAAPPPDPPARHEVQAASTPSALPLISVYRSR